MPKAPHETLLVVLRGRPTLLSTLVEQLTRRRLSKLRAVDATQRWTDPAEVRPDLLFVGRRPPWLAVEVQNLPDPAKPRRWALLVGLLFNRHRAMGELLVVTASARVARWVRTAIDLTSALGMRVVIRPTVLLLAAVR